MPIICNIHSQIENDIEGFQTKITLSNSTIEY